jgi:hypothetical protein
MGGLGVSAWHQIFGPSARHQPAQKIDQNVVKLDPAVFGWPDSIENLDNGTDVDVQPRFLAHFALDCGIESFAQFHRPAGKTPLALQRFARAANQNNLAPVDDDRADADDRARRIFTI